jgi:hypothetical protein
LTAAVEEHSDKPSISTKAGVVDVEAQVDSACAQELIPSTPLAKDVYRNVLKFPNYIVLTKVGNFYEVS